MTDYCTKTCDRLIMGKTCLMMLYWQVNRLVTLLVMVRSRRQQAETSLPRAVAEERGRH